MIRGAYVRARGCLWGTYPPFLPPQNREKTETTWWFEFKERLTWLSQFGHSQSHPGTRLHQLTSSRTAPDSPSTSGQVKPHCSRASSNSFHPTHLPSISPQPGNHEQNSRMNAFHQALLNCLLLSPWISFFPRAKLHS